MTYQEIETELSNITILADTREQPTQLFKDRLDSTGYRWERKKLDFGDYSVKTPNFDISDRVAIERKMNLDELAMCFGTQRKRFEAEFERAKSHGARVYLLVENISWDVLMSDDAYKMRCRSKYSRKSMVASIMAWSIRYNIVPVFCGSSSTGKIIGQILYREMKEYLNGLD